MISRKPVEQDNTVTIFVTANTSQCVHISFNQFSLYNILH